MKTKKWLIVLFFIIGISLGMVYMSSIDSKEKDIRFDASDVIDICDGWTYINKAGEEQIVDLPYEISEVKKNETYSISKVLDNIPENVHYIMIRTIHTNMKLYINDELVEEYGDRSSSIFFEPGCGWIIGYIDHGEGEPVKISIEYKAVTNKYAGTVNTVKLGNRGSLLLSVLLDNAMGVLMCGILFSIGIIIALSWLFTRKLINSSRLIYLSLFSFAVVVWSLPETNILQIFFGDMTVISTITFEALMILPIPLLLFFMSDVESLLQKSSKILLVLSILNFFVGNILQLLGVATLGETVISTHIFLLICAITLFVTTLMKKFNQKNRWYEEKMVVTASTIGLMFLIVTVGVDVTRYYILNYGDCGVFIRFGIIIYIFTLGVDSLSEAFNMMILGRKAKEYRQLAYRDMLTETMNRTAYKERLDKINDNLIKSKPIIVMIDINELKYINDKNGHTEGDEYIKRNVDYINSMLGDIGECYRIGGDEFVVVIPDKHIKEFYEIIKIIDDRLKVDDSEVNFAFGYARYDESIDNEIEDTIARADSLMYEKKQKMHKARSSSK